MKKTDYLLLACFCILLFGCSLVGDRPMTMHESVLPQCTREMHASGNWLIPSSGGRPWLHRPPLPHWVLLILTSPFEDINSPWMVRLGPLVMSTIVVLTLAWLAQRWFGRWMGLLSGLILATCFQFTRYAWLAEEDTFLCAVITGCLALFVKMEIPKEGEAPPGRWTFFGWRSWTLLAFFTLYGLSNMAKGLVFGPLMAGVPMGLFLLWHFSWKRFGNYVWLWGWLAAILAGGVWPLLIYHWYPDVLEMWLYDYAGRLNGNYIGEPWWYYWSVIPWAIAPWTLFSLVGLWVTGRTLPKAEHRPEHFLWCWAIGTTIFFSIPDGKHHHYYVHCLPPWAILAALGVVHVRNIIAGCNGLWRKTWLAPAVFALPVMAAVWLLRHKIPGPEWTVPVLLGLIPLAVWGVAWCLTDRLSLRAAGLAFLGLWAAYCGGYLYTGRYLDHGIQDEAFLRNIPNLVDGKAPLYVNAELRCCLEVNRVLFTLDRSTRTVHNLSFLLDEELTEPRIYVVTVAGDETYLGKIGSVRRLAQSVKSRRELTPDDRLTLFELTFKPDLQRFPNHVYIAQQQIKHRQPGPYLGGRSPKEW